MRVHLDDADVRRGGVRAQRVEQHAIRRGIVNGLPSASIALTPRSGSTSTTGPVAPLSCSAMRRPIAAHSSAVVRIRVTVALCR